MEISALNVFISIVPQIIWAVVLYFVCIPVVNIFENYLNSKKQFIKDIEEIRQITLKLENELKKSQTMNEDLNQLLVKEGFNRSK